MQKTLLFRSSLLLTSILSLSAFCLSQVTQKWVMRQNGDGNARDWASDLKVDHNGYIYVTGHSQVSGNNTDFTTIKYDAGSNTHWVKKYNGPGNGEDRAIAIAVDHDGNVYVTGVSTGSGTGTDFTTIKYDAGSNTKWVKRFNGTGNSNDGAVAIAIDDDGNVYVTGNSIGAGTSFDYTTIKYDDDGDTEWVRHYNGPGNSSDLPIAIAVDDNGNVYVTGQSNGSGTGFDYDYATVKYNANGDQQWVSRYNGPINAWDRPNALAVDHNGNVYVTGMISTFDGEEADLTDIATIKYNAAGVQQWAALYDRKGHDEANDLAVDAAGNVYITGLSGSAEEDPDNDYVTIKYNTTGIQQWASIYESPGTDQGGGANAILLDAAGNVYVTGGVGIELEIDYGTIKYNNNGVQQWVATYDGPANNDDEANAIGLDDNGNIYITGRSANEEYDFATIRYTSAGTQKWAKRYNSTGDTKGGTDIATALAVDGNGNVHVTGGIVKNITGSDYTTYKYNTDGDRQWKKTYNGPGIGPDQANAITTDAEGNVYITGRSDGNGTREDYATIKYDASGDTKWIRRYNGPANLFDEATAIVVDKDGAVYVTGQSTGSGPLGDYATVKYDKDGNQQWVRRYNGPANFTDRAVAIGVDPAGNVYVTGYSYATLTIHDYLTIKYDANGNELWVVRYDGPASSLDEPEAMIVDASGNVFITGGSWGSDGTADYATIKYNTAGVQQWEARYNGPVFLSHERAKDIAIDASGNVYVTGTSELNYTTIKYNAAGVQQWVAAYDGPGNSFDEANALTVDAAGNVYVTGGSRVNFFIPEDFATVKYNTAGEQQWVARYDGPGNSFDFATDIALDPIGNVYVIGQSTGIGTLYDYTTIKYEQSAPITTRQDTRPNTAVTAGEQEFTKLQATAFPNSFARFINIKWSGSNKPVTIQITDALGKLVERKNGLAGSGTLQTGHNFKPGVYFAVIVQGSEKIMLRLIKTN